MTPTQWAVWAWGVGGVGLVLVEALVRLTPRAVAVLGEPLSVGQWVAVATWCGFMLYSEAWRGFHRQFNPRVVVRALGVARDPVPWRVVLAPAVAMGLVFATPRRLAVAWGLVLGIVALIVVVRDLPHPWREIVDLGVVLGLGGGAASLGWHAARVIGGVVPDVPPDWPAPRR